MSMSKPQPKTQLFRVYIGQVNQIYVDVRATDADAAAEKGYRKWRRDDAHSRVLSVEKPDGRPTR